MEKCCICNEHICDAEQTVVLQQKGSDGVNRASAERGIDLRTIPGERVHVDCRRRHCKADNIARDIASQEPPVENRRDLRSLQKTFNFQEHCMFCGQPAKNTEGKRRGFDVFPVRTKDFQDTVIKICHSRNDKWSETVLGRLACVNDLHAADAVYHHQCSCNFRTGRNIPCKSVDDIGDTPKKSKPGRPETNQRTAAFLKVTHFLEENDDELRTVNELVLKMAEYLNDNEHEPYSAKYMKTRLQQHFGERVIMTVLSTKSCVVTLHQTAMSILHVFHKERLNENSDDEKLRIIQTAAKLIESDVKSMNTQNEVYPSVDDIESADDALDYLPDTLQLLLRTMFVGKRNDVKLAAIGQSIVQAIRPRALLAPLQLGLGVQMHHHFASRFLIDTLHKHGFSCSYADVTTYERNAAVVHGSDIPGNIEGRHIQYIADNVDHNVATIDGTGTFHGMGIIAAITPGTQAPRKPIPKLSVTAEEIAHVGRINIEFFKIPPGAPPHL